MSSDPTSLRNEVVERIDNGIAIHSDPDHITDVVLAVVREHISDLIAHDGVHIDREALLWILGASND